MVRNDSVIKLLSDLVAIDSQSYKGNLAIIAFLSDLFKDYKQTRQSWVREQDDVQGENLIVKISGKSSERSLVFICHMDTVPTSSAWETDPFILEESGGNLYGLGASDTKGGVAALIEAVMSLESQPAYDTYVVFDGDEEVIWTGVTKYKKHLTVKRPSFICVEPTDQNLCIAARGLISLEVQTYGKTQHASYATPEVNKKYSAIYKMHQVIDVLIQDANRLAAEKDSLLGSHTQNLGVITGGSADNVVPEFCKLLVDRRVLPHRDTQKEISRLKQLIHDVEPSAKVVMSFGQNGFATSATQPVADKVLQTLQEFYPKAIHTHFQAMSEGTILQDKGDVLVLGPGSIKQAHVANEYISAQELFTFVKIYQKIMQGISL